MKKYIHEEYSVPRTPTAVLIIIIMIITNIRSIVNNGLEIESVGLVFTFKFIFAFSYIHIYIGQYVCDLRLLMNQIVVT